MDQFFRLMDSTSSFPVDMIAPCGMNCGICIGHLRESKQCPGCHGDDENKPKHCVNCRIVNCEKIGNSASGFCYECDEYPCKRLKALDKRYRMKYSMSMIENLDRISEVGIDQFIEDERIRWTCGGCGKILCVHRDRCIYCGLSR